MSTNEREEMRREEMKCQAARDQFALLLYGELSFDEEERVESHLDGCADCRAALERQKALHDAVDAAAVTPCPRFCPLPRGIGSNT